MSSSGEHRAMKICGIVRMFLLIFLVLSMSVSPIFGQEAAHEFCLGQHAFSSSFLLKRPLAIPGIVRNGGLPGIDTPFAFQRNRLRTWVRTFGNWTEIGGLDQTPDLDAKTFGFSLGIDQQFGRNFLFGASFGGDWVNLKRKDEGSEKISAAFGSVYLRTTLRRLFLDFEGGLGYNDQDFAPKNDFQWNINGEIGTWWEQGLSKVEPYLGLRHVALQGDTDDETKTTFMAGLRYSWKTTGVFAVTAPRFYIGLLQELGDRNLLNAAQFIDAPTVYTLSGYDTPETRLFCGGGFTSSMGKSLDIYLRYTAELASNFSSHTLLLGMNWNF